MAGEEWTADEQRVARYLDRVDQFPHRIEGEAVLLEHVPRDARRILPGMHDGGLERCELGREAEDLRLNGAGQPADCRPDAQERRATENPSEHFLGCCGVHRVAHEAGKRRERRLVEIVIRAFSEPQAEQTEGTLGSLDGPEERVDDLPFDPAPCEGVVDEDDRPSGEEFGRESGLRHAQGDGAAVKSAFDPLGTR